MKYIILYILKDPQYIKDPNNSQEGKQIQKVTKI